MAALAQLDLAEADIKAKVKELILPQGVRLKDVQLDTDYSGDAAVYVIFAVSKNLGLGPARIRALGELRDRVFHLIDTLNLDRLAYVRFIDVK